MKKRCTCIHKAQDKLNGKQIRIHNKTGSTGKWGTGAKGYRCTVCGDVKPVTIR